MGKIPPKRIDSSDCVVYVGRKIADGKIVDPGTAHRVHEGEWIEVLPVATIGELVDYSRVLSARSLSSQELQAVAGDIEKAFEGVVQSVASRVYAWNWTDMDGQALPPPHNNLAVIKGLTVDELLWLLERTSYETPEERKNA